MPLSALVSTGLGEIELAARVVNADAIFWNALDESHLLALQGVVDAGSFRGAAERLGYSQGSVSAQIGARGAPPPRREPRSPALRARSTACAWPAAPANAEYGAGAAGRQRVADRTGRGNQALLPPIADLRCAVARLTRLRITASEQRSRCAISR